MPDRLVPPPLRPRLALVPSASPEERRALWQRLATEWDGRLIEDCPPFCDLRVIEGGRARDMTRLDKDGEH
jgi:hypothetical protein